MKQEVSKNTFDFGRRRATFRKLHETGCFVLPNPWDIGTAKYLTGLGFEALATTSAGFAFSQGLPDAVWAVSRDAVLAHITEIVAATSLPVNADFQSGYADDLPNLVENIKRCIATGVAGLSIEDATGDTKRPLYEIEIAVERVATAREVIQKSRSGVLLTARAECFLVGHAKPLKESIRRLERYAAAGADVLYAPGAQSREQIQAIVEAVKPKPVNILMSSNNGLSVAEVAALGARRISVGSSLARAAWTGFARAAKEIAKSGTFSGFDNTIPHAELDAFFENRFTRKAARAKGSEA